MKLNFVVVLIDLSRVCFLISFRRPDIKERYVSGRRRKRHKIIYLMMYRLLSPLNHTTKYMNYSNKLFFARFATYKLAKFPSEISKEKSIPSSMKRPFINRSLRIKHVPIFMIFTHRKESFGVSRIYSKFQLRAAFANTGRYFNSGKKQFCLPVREKII